MLKTEKLTFFHIYFFNMDILLIMKLTSMKTAGHVAEIYPEGRVSQKFDKGLSFLYLTYKSGLSNKFQKITKVSLFVLQNKN